MLDLAVYRIHTCRQVGVLWLSGQQPRGRRSILRVLVGVPEAPARDTAVLFRNLVVAPRPVSTPPSLSSGFTPTGCAMAPVCDGAARPDGGGGDRGLGVRGKEEGGRLYNCRVSAQWHRAHHHGDVNNRTALTVVTRAPFLHTKLE